MWLIVGALALGVLVGYSDILPNGIFKWNNRITMVGLAVLLFTMGISIGSNNEIISNLDTLGLKAFLLALGSVIGSIFLAWFLQNNFFRGGDKR
ncbi:MAG: lysine exporter LysO family protein [Clostridia bacterium]|nr:lysine exporter LysO family protein [Clostridia bacterium]